MTFVMGKEVRHSVALLHFNIGAQDNNEPIRLYEQSTIAGGAAGETLFARTPHKFG